MLGNALNITELTFSRKQETQADEFAVETLNCVYGHVSGATDFFEKIPREQDSGKFGHYFSTHPERRRRIFHLLEFIRMNEFSLEKRKSLYMPCGPYFNIKTFFYQFTQNRQCIFFGDSVSGRRIYDKPIAYAVAPKTYFAGSFRPFGFYVIIVGEVCLTSLKKTEAGVDVDVVRDSIRN